MSKTKNVFDLLMVVVLLFISANCSSKGSRKSLVIKGFYLGMPLNNAKNNAIEQFKNLNLTKYNIYTKEKSLYISSADDSTYLEFVIGRTINSNENIDAISEPIISIYFYPIIVNKLFNASELKSEQFVQQFLDSHDAIPKFDSGTSSFWSYTSDKGWKINIFDDKGIQLKTLP